MSKTSCCNLFAVSAHALAVPSQAAMLYTATVDLTASHRFLRLRVEI